jgi:hypothetical protein
MTFKTAVKEVLQYLLNIELQKKIAEANCQNDLTRKVNIQHEIGVLKNISDKLDVSK